MQQIHLTIPKDCEQAVWNWSSNLKVSTKDETVSAAKVLYALQNLFTSNVVALFACEYNCYFHHVVGKEISQQ